MGGIGLRPGASTRHGLRWAVGLVVGVALVVMLGLLTPGAMAAKRPKDHRPDLTRAGVLVIGDSITHRAKLQLGKQRPPGWSWDAFPGRRLTALTAPYGTKVSFPARTSADYWRGVSHIVRPRPVRKVSTVVIALGTNGADTDLTAAQAMRMYAAQIRRVRGLKIWNKGPKNVVLVTPWRNPAISESALRSDGSSYAPYMWAEKSVIYRQAIRQAARGSRNVRVMNWHSWAGAHPANVPDGVHPDSAGLRVWWSMVRAEVRKGRR